MKISKSFRIWFPIIFLTSSVMLRVLFAPRNNTGPHSHPNSTRIWWYLLKAPSGLEPAFLVRGLVRWKPESWWFPSSLLWMFWTQSQVYHSAIWEYSWEADRAFYTVIFCNSSSWWAPRLFGTHSNIGVMYRVQLSLQKTFHHILIPPGTQYSTCKMGITATCI